MLNHNDAFQALTEYDNAMDTIIYIMYGQTTHLKRSSFRQNFQYATYKEVYKDIDTTASKLYS